jgi:DNA-binding transcriptional MerR regulator
MEEKRWKVGELARETGLTVRTLHHWDEVGLVRPSERTQAGYRLYEPADVERLYRVAALRSLGLTLEQIRAALAGELALRELIERQLAAVDDAIRLQAELRRRLERLLDEPDHGAMIETLEVMTMLEKHYSPSSSQSSIPAHASWATRSSRTPRPNGPTWSRRSSASASPERTLPVRASRRYSSEPTR